MPIYTFYCPKCKHKFSDIYPMEQSDGKNVICPQCNKKGVKRVYEAPFFIKKNSRPTCSSGTCALNRK